MSQAYLAAVLLLATAAAAKPAPTPEQKLAKLTKGRVAGTPLNCILPEQAVRPEIIDGQTVVFRSTSTVYVVRPAGACSELREGRLLVFHTVSGLLCQNERFEVSEPPGPSGTGFCAFGPFTPYKKAR